MDVLFVMIFIFCFVKSFFSHPTWDKFIIEANTKRMKDMHRGWRSTLAAFIYGKNKGKDPFVPYPHMKREDWDQFVRDRTTEEALVSYLYHFMPVTLLVYLFYHILIGHYLYFFCRRLAQRLKKSLQRMSTPTLFRVGVTRNWMHPC